MQPYSNKQKTNGRKLRRAQTDAERKLWTRLRDRQIGGAKFRRQHSVGRFITDFCCVEPWIGNRAGWRGSCGRDCRGSEKEHLPKTCRISIPTILGQRSSNSTGSGAGRDCAIVANTLTLTLSQRARAQSNTEHQMIMSETSSWHQCFMRASQMADWSRERL
jgi:hypothetical protein